MYYDFRELLNGDPTTDGESKGLMYGDGVSPPHFGSGA